MYFIELNSTQPSCATSSHDLNLLLHSLAVCLLAHRLLSFCFVSLHVLYQFLDVVFSAIATFVGKILRIGAALNSRFFFFSFFLLTE